MVYKIAFKAARGVWGQWYEQESRQEKVREAGLSSVGQARREVVRVTFDDKTSGSEDEESECT